MLQTWPLRSGLVGAAASLDYLPTLSNLFCGECGPHFFLLLLFDCKKSLFPIHNTSLCETEVPPSPVPPPPKCRLGWWDSLLCWACSPLLWSLWAPHAGPGGGGAGDVRVP